MCQVASASSASSVSSDGKRRRQSCAMLRLLSAPAAQGAQLMALGDGRPPPHVLHSPFQATVPANVALPHHILPRPSYAPPADSQPHPQEAAAAAAAAPDDGWAATCRPEQPPPAAPAGRLMPMQRSPPRRRPSLQLPLSGIAPPYMAAAHDISGASDAAGYPTRVSAALQAMPSVASRPPTLPSAAQAHLLVGTAEPYDASPWEAPRGQQHGSAAVLEAQGADVATQQAASSAASSAHAGPTGMLWPAAAPAATDDGGAAPGGGLRAAGPQSPTRHPPAWPSPTGSAPVLPWGEATACLHSCPNRIPLHHCCSDGQCRLATMFCPCALLMQDHKEASGIVVQEERQRRQHSSRRAAHIVQERCSRARVAPLQACTSSSPRRSPWAPSSVRAALERCLSSPPFQRVPF